MKQLPTDPWSLGILTGPSPLVLREPAGVANPVLTREQVTDCTAAFIADPFLIRREQRWYLFFEILDFHKQKGTIGMAVSENGHGWSYGGVVLEESFHLSYPFVFEHEDAVYMIPETLGAGAVRLYKATGFPLEWEHVYDLLPFPLADVTAVRFEGRWWLFGCNTPDKHDGLVAFYSQELKGVYQPHRQNPLIKNNPLNARPAGRMIPWANGLLRFAQVCAPRYGMYVNINFIEQLGPETWREEPLGRSEHPNENSPDWLARGQHHMDCHQQPDGSWLAIIDGHHVLDAS